MVNTTKRANNDNDEMWRQKVGGMIQQRLLHYFIRLKIHIPILF